VGQVYPANGTNGSGSHEGEPATATEAEQKPATIQGAGELEVNFTGDENAVADLLETLIAQKARIASFSETNTGLEEVFLRLTKGEVA
jgi:hypothetical protein